MQELEAKTLKLNSDLEALKNKIALARDKESCVFPAAVGPAMTKTRFFLPSGGFFCLSVSGLFERRACFTS